MKDPILQTIVRLASADTPIEHDVTLIVDGFLVSGFVVSIDKYMKHHHTVNLVWNEWKRIDEESQESPESDDPDEFPDDSPYYIHLRDAKYYTPGGNPIPGNMGVYCRIALESVYGFSFGLLSDENR